MSRLRRIIPLFIVVAIIILGGIAYLALDHFGVKTLISTVGVFGVAAIIFAESGLLIGFFLPGDSLLFTAGFLVQQNIMQINIFALALILFAAAAAGDSTGYAIGRRAGRSLFNKDESLLFSQKNVHRAQAFYEKHGSKTIVIARFVPVVRTFAPIVAGIGGMHYRTFVTFNMIGALLWAVGLTFLGYSAGGFITMTGINIEYVILGIIFISILPPAIHILREKENRTAIMTGIRNFMREFKKK